MSKKELTKEQKKKANKFTIIFMIIVIGIVATVFAKYMNKVAEKVDIYFDPLEFQISDNGTNRTLTEEEIIQKLGEPTSSEEWKYEKANGNYFMLKTLTYQKNSDSYREYIINLAPDGTNNLIRINLYEKIPYKNKYAILKMFNLHEYKNSKIDDKNVYYRAKNVGVYDFWIPSMNDKELDVVKFTFYNGLD